MLEQGKEGDGVRIAICDDIPKELEKILAALGAYEKTHPQLCFEIDEYRTAMDILNAVEKGKAYDIAFLRSEEHWEQMLPGKCFPIVQTWESFSCR